LAAARAREGWPHRCPRRRPSSVLSRRPGGLEAGSGDARANVERRTVAAQTAGRARGNTTRSASKTRETEEPMTEVSTLPHSLEKHVLIRATRETVFRFFTDND